MTSWHERHAWYWISASIPAVAIVAFAWGQPWLFLCSLVLAILAGDTLIGVRGGGYERSSDPIRIRLAIPFGFICLWGFSVLVAAARARHAPLLQLAGFSLACGILSAFATAHIHELMHRGNAWTQAISDSALALAGYPHYRIVHELHHAHVGDTRYGSTAPMGLSVWKHVGCSFGTALLAAVGHDMRRKRAGKKSRLFWPAAAWAGAVAAFAIFAGGHGVLFYLAQGVVSIFVVESIGYIQHYGLDYEPKQSEQQIAWDMPFWLSNRLFVNNGFHTHHHLEPALPFTALRRTGAALPAGYLHMFLLSLVPPLWFAVMDPRIIESPDTMEAQETQD